MPSAKRLYEPCPSTGNTGLDWRIHPDIGEIPAGVWDSLVPPRDLLARHRFVAACQASEVENARYWHVLFSRRSQPVAVTTLFRMEVALDLLSGPGLRRAAGWGRKLRSGFLRIPVLFCGLPVSLGQSTLRLAPGEEAPTIAHAVSGIMNGIATSEGIDLLCIKELDGAERDRWSEFEKLGYRAVPSLPYGTLPLRWRSLEDYAEDLRSGYRRQLRQTLELRLAEDFTVTHTDDPGPLLEDALRLYGNVIERTPHRLESLDGAFFRELHYCFPEQLSAVAIERRGRRVATALLLHTSGSCTFLLAGLDYERGGGRSYPLLTVEVLREALRRGARRLHLGQTSYSLKTRLGCDLEPRYLFLKHRRRLVQHSLDAARPWLFPETEAPVRRVFRS